MAGSSLESTRSRALRALHRLFSAADRDDACGVPCASRVGRARRDGAREGRRGCSGRRRSYRSPASAAAANAAAAGAAARAAGARIARRVLPSGSLEAAGRQYSLDLTSRARAEARTARARPAASRRRRNMATVQPLRRRKRLAGSAVCRRRAVLGCCPHPRGLQKASASGTTRPPSQGRSKPSWTQP